MKISIIAKREYPELKKLKGAFEVVEKGEICIAVGGDGTFMHAAQNFSCPILLIRDNSLDSTGYYSDIGIDRIEDIIKLLLLKKYKVESIGKKLEIKYKNKKYYAVNECYLSNDMNEVAFKSYEIKNNKRKLLYPFVVGGDGLIIAGKIGSTAYNRTAGGPILLEKNLLCITFINPDGPYRNSLVISSNKVIEIELTKYDGILRYDNFKIGKLSKNAVFTVRTSKREIRVIKLYGIEEGFGDKLQRVINSKMQKA